MKDKVIKEREAIKVMEKIGADPCGIKIMKDKAVFRLVCLKKIKPALANIIKESMLSSGGDAALHKLCCACKVEYSDVLIMGTIAQYKHLLKNIERQPYGGKEIRRRLWDIMDLQ